MRVGQFFVSIVLIILGLLHLFDPEDMIHLRVQWFYRSTEPSDAYILMTRILGGAATAIGIYCLYTSIF